MKTTSCFRTLRIASALRAFYLIVLIVARDILPANTLGVKSPTQGVLEHLPATIPRCDNVTPTGPIETTLCDYETVESVNKRLYDNLSVLVRTPFFKYFQVDLYRECPFWSDSGSCSNPGCAITTLDESDVPEKWRATSLSKLDSSSIEKLHTSVGCYYRDSDFCYLDDNTEGDYYDLTTIPERYTGYSGVDAQRVWNSIYQENCFGLSELNSGSSGNFVSLPETMTGILRTNNEHNEQCLEKRVYYKIISGLHASISTHICHEWLNQTTGEWQPNLQCFVSRVASHPERLQYIYFNSVLLQRAVVRLAPYLMAYDYCSTGTHEDDEDTRALLVDVVSTAKAIGKFDEKILFRGEDADDLKEEFKKHFRNVTRIMDCVGCDKCRLWGKIQTTGIATAMKILFEIDEEVLDPIKNPNLLQRIEVVALINTLHRITESLEAFSHFRDIWANLDAEETATAVSQSQSNPKPTVISGGRTESLLNLCKDSVIGCTELFQQGVSALGSLFRKSGKENGPGALYGDL